MNDRFRDPTVNHVVDSHPRWDMDGEPERPVPSEEVASGAAARPSEAP